MSYLPDTCKFCKHFHCWKKLTLQKVWTLPLLYTLHSLLNLHAQKKQNVFNGKGESIRKALSTFFTFSLWMHLVLKESSLKIKVTFIYILTFHALVFMTQSTEGVGLAVNLFYVQSAVHFL